MNFYLKMICWSFAALLGVVEGVSVFYLWGNTVAPLLAVDKTVIDFGTVPVGLEMTRDVHIMNRGNAPLIINKVQTGCGCTQVSLSQDIVESHGSATLQIGLKGDGSISKVVAIYIVSNDPRQPVCKLLATYDSITKSFVEPRGLDFGQIDKTTQLPNTKSFRLFLKKESGATLDVTDLSITADEPYIQVDSSKPLEGNTREISVSLSKDTPTGDIYSQLRLDDSRNSISIKMNVIGNVRGEYVALPQMITLGPVNPESDTISENIVVIKRNASARDGEKAKSPLFNITSIKISDALKDLISVRREQDSENSSVSVTLTPKTYAGIWSTRQVFGSVELHCESNDGYGEVLNIPIVVTLRIPKILDH